MRIRAINATNDGLIRTRTARYGAIPGRAVGKNPVLVGSQVRGHGVERSISSGAWSVQSVNLRIAHEDED